MSEVAELTPPSAPEPVKTKAKKPKKEPSVRRSKFSELYPAQSPLILLVAENPKKKGSAAHQRFEGYFGAKTVADALKAGVKYGDIAYDVGRNHIKVG